MRLNAQKFVRLYAVSEKEKNGKYALKEFGAKLKKFNGVINMESLHKIIICLGLFLWDEVPNSYIEVTEEMKPNENGRLCLNIGDGERLDVRDIVDKIDADRKKCRYFVLVNTDRDDCRWVVVVPAGTVYSD